MITLKKATIKDIILFIDTARKVDKKKYGCLLAYLLNYRLQRFLRKNHWEFGLERNFWELVVLGKMAMVVL